MGRPPAWMVSLVCASLALTACSRGDAATNTTASAGGAPLTNAASTPGTPSTDGATIVPASPPTTRLDPTTTDPGGGIPTYTIVQRIEEEEGVTAVILLDPNSYDALTDIDLQNVVEDAVERFRVYVAHVVDSPAAAEIVLAEFGAPTIEGQALLDEHYLVRLEEGFRLVFEGPFSSQGTVILGS